MLQRRVDILGTPEWYQGKPGIVGDTDLPIRTHSDLKLRLSNRNDRSSYSIQENIVQIVQSFLIWHKYYKN